MWALVFRGQPYFISTPPPGGRDGGGGGGKVAHQNSNSNAIYFKIPKANLTPPNARPNILYVENAPQHLKTPKNQSITR